ncbi:MAG: LURP-one-related family protein [Clostridia bacterium]|nr:LURP-one-related family protein [Clostridia bacterium]MBR5383739.1 LURP-one-related family protein [Clostridia bacterium]
MGVFSKYHRFREAGEAANVNNVERFGEPVRSLFTTTRIISVHHNITVTDEHENPVYYARSKFFSLHDKTDIIDADSHFIAHMERKFWTLHQRHYVTMADGQKFELSNELFHLIKDITNIEGLGWQLRGNILGLNFELYDYTGSIIAVISQKMLSIHDKYCVDIYMPEQEKIVVAILITLQHMIRDRQNSSSSSSFSSSSSN